MSVPDVRHHCIALPFKKGTYHRPFDAIESQPIAPWNPKKHPVIGEACLREPMGTTLLGVESAPRSVKPRRYLSSASNLELLPSTFMPFYSPIGARRILHPTCFGKAPPCSAQGGVAPLSIGCVWRQRSIDNTGRVSPANAPITEVLSFVDNVRTVISQNDIQQISWTVVLIYLR